MTPQELQIARLAAEGLTNRGIGEKLFLSHRTIESHLYRIFLARVAVPWSGHAGVDIDARLDELASLHAQIALLEIGACAPLRPRLPLH